MNDDKLMVDEKNVNPKKIPKNIMDQIKIGTKEEVYWTEVKKKMEDNLINFQHEIIITNQVLKLAQMKIKIEEHRREEMKNSEKNSTTMTQ